MVFLSSTTRRHAPRGRAGLLAVSGRQLFQSRQAALYFFGVDTVGKAHIALDAKGIAGHQQQVELAGLQAEGIGVLLQCLGEDVEGAAGALHLKAQRRWMMLGGQLWPVKREIWAIISTRMSSPSQPGRTAT